MTCPIATYRLQFRNGMTLGRAAALAGYLRRLGISHLYASPLFAATPGSSHGYDGTDFDTIEPEIGGEQGFDQLCAALDEAGLGLLLDFVPNHMATDETNRWWHSVLEWGRDSPHAAVFDIDWSAPKLVLPVLGKPYGEALAEGTLGLAFDAATGRFTFTAYDRRFPLTPPSYGLLLARLAEPALVALAEDFAAARIEAADALMRRLADLVRDSSRAGLVGEAVAAADAELIHAVHEAQIWRLADWRLGRDALTHRRFFEVDELICLRVEDPAVFDRVHRRLLALLAEGRVAGVRLDHIDGLADPRRYLERLQRAAVGPSPAYLLVEKILEDDERLPEDWPIAGTTGYEFIAALSGLFVERRLEAEMSSAYEDFAGPVPDYAEAARDAKREILERNLAAELALLTARAQAIAARDLATRDLGEDTLRRAIMELVAQLPVYRTYVDAGGPSPADRTLLERIAGEAKASLKVDDPAAIDFVVRQLLLDVEEPEARAAALAFATRFQQTSGPVMAKAVEDTLFYRYNRLVALNEVGGSPRRYGAPRRSFHAAMAERRRRQPSGLSATGSHDTKRGEDARARLYALSEMPEIWQRAVTRWSAMNAPFRAELDGGPAPEPAMEWLFYQALAGAWPADLPPFGPRDAEGPALASLRARMLAYMEKAAREAKLRTSWTLQEPVYEAAVAGFVTALLSVESGRGFLVDFAETCRPLWLAGAVNALAQLAVKLAAPGVPDFYQGAELWDFSLVDPDNRLAVDFGRRERLLASLPGSAPEALLEDWVSGAPKLALTEAGLRIRAEHPALFAEGAYLGLETAGTAARQVVAFARTLDDALAVVVVPRLVLSLLEGAERPLVPAERWGDTALVLPDAMRDRALRDVLTGRTSDGGGQRPVADLLSRFPVALLVGSP